MRAGLLLLTLVAVVSCQRSPQPETSVTADCTVVEHVAGKACVPNQIQRLVTLDGVSFEYAIALGEKPIATAFGGYMDYLAEQMVGVETVGQVGEPSLERVVALKPDLILGLDHNQDIYSQAAQIAPTVLFSFEHSGQWKQVFQRMAAELERSEAAQRTLDDYDARLADFKTQMGDRLNDLEVSVVRIYPDTINLYLRDSFVGTVLQDAGLARPTAQDIGAAEAEQQFGNPIQTSISRELFEQADGDVIFLWTGQNSAEENARLQQEIDALQRDPLWQRLKAVQAERVYQVPSYWIGWGPLAANAVLDDLFTYLVEPS